MSGTTYGAFSDYLERQLLGHVFCGIPFSRPPALFVSLFTTAPSDAGPGTEPPAALGYDRVAVTFALGPALTDGSSSASNTNVIQFAAASAGWGVVQWVGVHDAASGGNLLAWGALTSSRPVNQGDAVRFGVAQLALGLQ
jgi:hypothetical protein